MKTVYGIPVPRGVRKDWTVRDRSPLTGEPFVLIGYGIPRDWGKPEKAVAWYDRFGRCRAIVGHYANGRAVLVRIDANGARRYTYGDAPRDSGSGPQGGDNSLAPGEAPQSGRSDSEGIAHPLSGPTP